MAEQLNRPEGQAAITGEQYREMIAEAAKHQPLNERLNQTPPEAPAEQAASAPEIGGVTGEQYREMIAEAAKHQPLNERLNQTPPEAPAQ